MTMNVQDTHCDLNDNLRFLRLLAYINKNYVVAPSDQWISINLRALARSLGVEKECVLETLDEAENKWQLQAFEALKEAHRLAFLKCFELKGTSPKTKTSSAKTSKSVKKARKKA